MFITYLLCSPLLFKNILFDVSEVKVRSRERALEHLRWTAPKEGVRAVTEEQRGRLRAGKDSGKGPGIPLIGPCSAFA